MDSGDLPHQLAAALKQCKHDEIDLLVLHECYFGGMPSSAEHAREVAAEASDLLPALEKCSPGTTVVAGFTERGDGVFHSSAAVIRQGVVLGVSRKLFPIEPVFSPGDSLPRYQIGEIEFGVVICYDCNFVEPSRLLALAGARLLVCPLNNNLRAELASNWVVRTRSNLIARAVENDCWVVAADVAGESKGRRGVGASSVIAPDGGVVAKRADEGLVVAEVAISEMSLLERWNVGLNPAIASAWRKTQPRCQPRMAG